jgi:hypothetical protein
MYCVVRYEEYNLMPRMVIQVVLPLGFNSLQLDG